MKEFKEYIGESNELDITDKDDMIELLMDLDEQLETPLEAELVSLLVSLIKMDKLESDSFDSIVDAIDSIIDFEHTDLGYDYDENYEDDYDEDEEDEVDEAQRALYKRAGYIKCPDGRIRKRGKCGKPLDRKRSRQMVKARKKFKRSFAKGQRKAQKTKRRLGMVK